LTGDPHHPGDVIARARAAGRRYAFAVVPAIGLVELVVHLAQTHSVPTDEDWRAARSAVERRVNPNDLVIFAPEWTEPLGRQHFGAQIASVERIARPDETRFPRAVEVSIRGAERPELAGWRRLDRERVGPFAITTLQNPTPAQVLDDLVEHIRPDAVTVSVVDGDRETACPWTRGAVLTGGLGFGPSAPAERFVCPGGGWIAVTVISDPSYRPRRCIYAPPFGGSTSLRLRFKSVMFGRVLHGHHAIAAEADHSNGSPVSVVFRTGSDVLGRFTRHDGTGWLPFEAETQHIAGTTAELVVDIGAARGEHRQYCFEADTR
jgi:hypothetical protein